MRALLQSERVASRNERFPSLILSIYEFQTIRIANDDDDDDSAGIGAVKSSWSQDVKN